MCESFSFVCLSINFKVSVCLYVFNGYERIFVLMSVCMYACIYRFVNVQCMFVTVMYVCLFVCMNSSLNLKTFKTSKCQLISKSPIKNQTNNYSQLDSRLFNFICVRFLAIKTNHNLSKRRKSAHEIFSDS